MTQITQRQRKQAPSLRLRRSLNRLLNLTRTIFSDPRSAKTGSVQVKEATSIKKKESSGGGGGGGGGLHAEQHFEYHRHVGPGDVLTAEVKPGKTWEKEGKRSGKLVFSETITEYRDQNGELAITARGVGVRTERPVDQ